MTTGITLDSEPLHREILSLEHTMQRNDGMEQRFLEGFTRFLQDKKRQAVTTLLQEELPHLAQSDHFINNVLNKLDDTVVEEKRFVFLVLNPKLKQS